MVLINYAFELPVLSFTIDCSSEVHIDDWGTYFIDSLHVANIGVLFCPDEQHLRQQFWDIGACEEFLLLVSSLDVLQNFLPEKRIVSLHSGDWRAWFTQHLLGQWVLTHCYRSLWGWLLGLEFFDILAFQFVIFLSILTQLLHFLLPVGLKTKSSQTHPPNIEAITSLVKDTVADELGKFTLVFCRVNHELVEVEKRQGCRAAASASTHEYISGSMRFYLISITYSLRQTTLGSFCYRLINGTEKPNITDIKRVDPKTWLSILHRK